jgi:conjugative transfer region protein (TIGR03750 family)
VDAPLQAGRLNAEPVLFRGCTYTELGVIVAAAILFWLPAAFALAGLLGRVSMGLGGAAIGVAGTVYWSAGLFQRIKRGRPEGYYQDRVALWLHDRGLRNSGYIRRSGAWDIGRRV